MVAVSVPVFARKVSRTTSGSHFSSRVKTMAALTMASAGMLSSVSSNVVTTISESPRRKAASWCDSELNPAAAYGGA